MNKIKFVLLMLVLLLGFCLTSCNSSKIINIYEDNNGAMLNINEDNTLKISLPNDCSETLTWVIVEFTYINSYMETMSKKDVSFGTSQSDTCINGLDVIQFKLKSKGQYWITLAYAQPWENAIASDINFYENHKMFQLAANVR